MKDISRHLSHALKQKKKSLEQLFKSWRKDIVLKYYFNCLEICWVKLTVKHGSSKMLLSYIDEKIYDVEKQELNLKKFLRFYILVDRKK